jgi:hypothetical protein
MLLKNRGIFCSSPRHQLFAVMEKRQYRRSSAGPLDSVAYFPQHRFSDRGVTREA